MRFDYFLANLLFGMTLLTAFMSAAHLIGDVAVASTRLSRKASVMLRILILIACSLASLILFMAKLTGMNINQTLFSDAGLVEPRLVQRGGFVSPNSQGAQDETATATTVNEGDHSWTLYNVFSEETTSELRAQSEMLKTAPTLVSLVTPQSQADCIGWRDQAVALGLKVTNAASLPSTKTRPFVLACASDIISTDKLAAIRDLVTDGGSVLLVGKIRGQTSTTVSQLLLAKSWRQPEISDSARISLGGSFLATGGLPAGFRIDFGPSWINQAGLGFAEVEGEGRDFSLAQLASRTDSPTAFSALIVRNFGRGRIAWTSLPARLGSQLDSLYGPYWNLLTVRLFARMAGVPLIGIDNIPAEAPALVVPAVHAQYDFKNGRAMVQILGEMTASPAFYIVMSEALADQRTFENILASRSEIGVSGMDHGGSRQPTFFEVARRYSEWRRNFRVLETESSAANNRDEAFGMSSDLPPGAIVPGGMYSGAAAYGALLANRYAYVLGDPFNDWMTPYQISMDRTSLMRDRALTHKPVRTLITSDEISILPMAFGDDFQYIMEGRLISRSQMLARMMNQFETARRLGGPYVLPVHTQVLGSSEGRDALKTAMASMKKANASFMAPRDYVRWYRSKSALSYRAEIVSPSEIVIHLTNVGVDKAQNLSLSIVADEDWQFPNAGGTADGGADRTQAALRGTMHSNVKELRPGQTIEWTLRKRTSPRN
jgi:hypothetical protein